MRNTHGSARKIGDIEMRLLRIELGKRNLRVADLGKIIGYPQNQVTNALSASPPSWPVLAAINRALRQNVFIKPEHKSRKPQTPQTP
jgi:hypothetical protein